MVVPTCRPYNDNCMPLRESAKYLFAGAVVSATIWLMLRLRPHANLTTVALCLVLVVTACAIRWGRGPALLAALCAGLCFNYFFIPPTYTWNIANAQDWTAFLVFFATALLVGQLWSHAQQQAESAERRRREIERLYQQLQLAFEEASAAETLRRSEKLKTALLDAVTHDLRTPLTSIKASVTTLLGPAGQAGIALQPDARRELLEVINEETDRLNHFVEEMMQLAQVEAGVLPLKPAPVPAAEVIQSALGRAEALVSRHAVEVTVDAKLPPLLVDGPSISGVVFELLENAAKYSAPGSAIHIVVRPREADPGQVEIGVEDQGSGIPRHLHARVFDKFFRAPQGRDGRGFGLGLAIARGIVEAHGGHIWIEDPAHGRGTAMWFTVPCRRAV